MTPTGRPSIRASAVTISGAKRGAQERHRALVGERLDDRRDVVGAPLALGHELAQQRLVGRRRPPASRPGSRRAAASRPRSPRPRRRPRRRRRRSAPAPRSGRPRRASTVAEAAALDHRRAAHPERGVLGRDDQVGAAGDHRVAGEAAPGDDRDPRHDAREPRPERERARVEGRDDRVVGVAGPPAATLGEEDGRQAHPLDQLEQAVLLAVPERALGAGEHRVVVGEDRAGGALAEQLAVDPRGAADQAVGRRALDQVLERRGGRAARRSRSARTRRRCPGRRGPRCSPARSGRPPRGGARPPRAAPRRQRQRAARPQRREVVSLSILARPLHATREPSHSRGFSQRGSRDSNPDSRFWRPCA